MTRSVRSRSTGFVALRYEPQATDPVAPSAFCQIISPRNSMPRSSCRMRMMSADRLRYGLRPRLATLIAIRPPGSRTRRQLANTSCSIWRYSRYVVGMAFPSRRVLGSPATANSYSLPTKYGGDVTTSATLFSGNTSWILRLSMTRTGSARTESGTGVTSLSSLIVGGENRA